MSRTRDAYNAAVREQIAARRNSPQHRALRRRAQARSLPDAVVESSAPVTEQVETTALPIIEDTLVLTDPVREPVADEVAISPYESAASAEDPTPTQAFAIAMGAAPRRRRRWLAVALGVVVVLVLAYGAAAVLLRNAVPHGTTIAGVPAGDSVVEAKATVKDLAAAALAAPVTLRAGDNSATVNASDSGLSIDIDATVAQATGFTLDPVALWHRVSGQGTEHDLVVRVNEPVFADAVHTAATELNSTLVDANVTIVGTTATMTEGSQAVTVDVAAARSDILAQWPANQLIEVTADVTDPAVTTSQAAALAATLNAHVFAGPTTLTGPNVNAVLPAQVVAQASTIDVRDGSLAWSVDGAALSTFILNAYPDVENAASDASYRFTKAHKLKVRAGEPARSLDVPAVGDAVLAAAATTARSAPLPYVETPPEVTADDLPTQDFKELISHFRTPLTNEPIRTRNLVRAAELVTGTIVKPGEKFDLTKVISPITRENGYYEAHIIVGGVFTNGMGGGLSQMATTTYNAGYFAGYGDITHRPHTVWFPRYPAGRESTMYTGQINVVFENTTPYAMIMNSYVEDGYLNVDIWSTPYYTVKTKASPKTNIKQPTVVTRSGKGCEAKGFGEPGFTITNTRWVYHDDELVEKRSWTWTYNPDNAVKCVD